MANEEPDFDIDVYGDGEGEEEHHNGENFHSGDYSDFEYREENSNEQEDQGDQNGLSNNKDTTGEETDWLDGEPYTNGNGNGAEDSTDQTAAPTDPSTADQPAHPSQSQPQAEPQQGMKRKISIRTESPSLPTDPGATTALLISDLHWWTTEDEIRGWSNSAGVESSLKDVSFSEHKVNGKSKGCLLPRFLL